MLLEFVKAAKDWYNINSTGAVTSFSFFGGDKGFVVGGRGGGTFLNHPIYNSSYADSCRDVNSLQKLNDMYESL